VSGKGPLAESLEIDIPGIISAGVKTEDEGLFLLQHQYWLKVLEDAVDKERAATNGKTNGKKGK